MLEFISTILIFFGFSAICAELILLAIEFFKWLTRDL